MKTKKEYPATHSMSTAWYTVDEDGNVAIIEYDENGPVPYEVPSPADYAIEDLVYEVNEIDNLSSLQLKLNYTDEQALDIVSGAKDTCADLVRDYFDYIIQIDTTKERRFFELIEKARFIKGSYYVYLSIISSKMGVYSLRLSDCEDIIKALIEEKVILKTKIDDIELENEFLEENCTISAKEANLPFYVYKQPYWTTDLIERVSQPEHPVKAEQLASGISNVTHLPFRFSEVDKFQIAEYLPSRFYYGGVSVDGVKSYHALPLTNGEAAFFREDEDKVNYIPIDDAFENHQVEFDKSWGNEFSINGKRGYFFDRNRDEFHRIGNAQRTPISEDDCVEFVERNVDKDSED